MKLQFENELKTQLRRQAEVHKDHLDDVAFLKDKEAERKIQQNISEKVEDLKINYNRQLAKIIGRMKGLDIALKGTPSYEKINLLFEFSNILSYCRESRCRKTSKTFPTTLGSLSIADSLHKGRYQYEVMGRAAETVTR